MEFLSLDIIAGALVAFAALPKIWRRAQDQRRAGAKALDIGDLQRDMLIIAGNALWVVFGLQHAIYGLVVFGAINALLTSLLVFQAIIFQSPKPMA